MKQKMRLILVYMPAASFAVFKVTMSFDIARRSWPQWIELRLSYTVAESQRVSMKIGRPNNREVANTLANAA